MKTKVLLATKIIAIAGLLLLFDIATRYIIERIDLFGVRPVTIPNYNSNHLMNILSSFPYLFVMVGWSYILVTFFYHLFRKKSKFSWYFNSIVGFLFFMIFFLIYWLFDRGGMDNGISLLKEGIMVYLILGLLIEFIFSLSAKAK